MKIVTDYEYHYRVEDLPLPTRTINVLLHAGYDNVGKIEAEADAKLLAIDGLGRRSLDEIRNVIRAGIEIHGTRDHEALRSEIQRLKGEISGLKYALRLAIGPEQVVVSGAGSGVEIQDPSKTAAESAA